MAGHDYLTKMELPVIYLQNGSDVRALDMWVLMAGNCDAMDCGISRVAAMKRIIYTQGGYYCRRPKNDWILCRATHARFNGPGIALPSGASSRI
jgi:hypothetical protein